MTVLERIERCGIVPVIVLEDAEKAIPTARALLAGGIDVMEITFRTAAAAQAIENVARAVPEMLVGAGTVITPEQLERALAAGAQFVVSPGTDETVITEARQRNVLILPGVVTPSELMAGLRLGLEVFKFFPAGNYGGIKTVKALAGPFPGVRFVPTGGISADNAAEYLQNKKVLAIGGSWMATADMIAAEQYDRITALSREAAALAEQRQQQGERYEFEYQTR